MTLHAQHKFDYYINLSALNIFKEQSWRAKKVQQPLLPPLPLPIYKEGTQTQKGKNHLKELSMYYYG